MRKAEIGQREMNLFTITPDRFWNYPKDAYDFLNFLQRNGVEIDMIEKLRFILDEFSKPEYNGIQVLVVNEVSESVIEGEQVSFRLFVRW